MAWYLPPTAPAGDQGWCTFILPLMEGLLTLPPDGCGIALYIRSNKDAIKAWNVHLAQPESPDPTSDAELILHTMWKNFMSYGAAYIIWVAECLYDPVRLSNGWIIDIKPKEKKPSILTTDYVKCFGDVSWYPPPAKLTECATTNNINTFTTGSLLEYYVIDILQLWLTAKSVRDKAATICGGEGDFPEPCCTDLKNLLNSIIEAFQKI